MTARTPNHVWLLDLTKVRSLFGLRSFALTAVIDAFSRTPFALRAFGSEPTAEHMAALVSSAVRRHGRPSISSPTTEHSSQPAHSSTC